jgi:hypothetical protein
MDEATYAVARYTELQACISLLWARYFELAEETERLATGDFQYQRNADLLSELRLTLKELKEEVKKVVHKLPQSQMGIAGSGWDWTVERDNSEYTGLWRPQLDPSGF